jgi:hypothetical protein
VLLALNMLLAGFNAPSASASRYRRGASQGPGETDAVFPGDRQCRSNQRPPVDALDPRPSELQSKWIYANIYGRLPRNANEWSEEGPFLRCHWTSAARQSRRFGMCMKPTVKCTSTAAGVLIITKLPLQRHDDRTDSGSALDCAQT